MMQTYQLYILLALAAGVCFAYQSIPESIKRLHESGNSQTMGGLVRETGFTIFIRWCGYDHIVMAGGMMWMVWRPDLSYWIMWGVIASESLVLLVSGLAARAVFRAREIKA